MNRTLVYVGSLLSISIVMVVSSWGAGPKSPADRGKQSSSVRSQDAGRSVITTRDVNNRLTDILTLAHKAQAAEQQRQGIYMRGTMKTILPEIWKTDDGQLLVLVSPGTEVLWGDDEMKVTIGADWHTPFIAQRAGEDPLVVSLRNGAVTVSSAGKLNVTEGTEAKLDKKEFIFKDGRWRDK